ncbi:hypothetical protein MHU86_10488 [Fragilaria crotonensis]|nr:hypothetical protein MHU86_10488 [Fragilaria crotonensis]
MKGAIQMKVVCNNGGKTLGQAISTTSSPFGSSSDNTSAMRVVCNEGQKANEKAVDKLSSPFNSSSSDVKMCTSKHKFKHRSAIVVFSSATLGVPSSCVKDHRRRKANVKAAAKLSSPFDSSSKVKNAIRGGRNDRQRKAKVKEAAKLSSPFDSSSKSTNAIGVGRNDRQRKAKVKEAAKLSSPFDSSSESTNAIGVGRSDRQKANRKAAAKLSSPFDSSSEDSNAMSVARNNRRKANGKAAAKLSSPFDLSSEDSNAMSVARNNRRKANGKATAKLSSPFDSSSEDSNAMSVARNNRRKANGKAAAKLSSPFDLSSEDSNAMSVARNNRRKANGKAERRVCQEYYVGRLGCNDTRKRKGKAVVKECSSALFDLSSDDNWKSAKKHNKPLDRCHTGVKGPFGRTLPGELARSIIGAGGFNCPRIIAHTVPGVCDTPVDPMEQHCATTRKSRRAERRAAWANKESIAGILRDHPSRSFATHSQVARVIAKSLPLHSVDPFLAAFNSFIPPPPKKGTQRIMHSPPVKCGDKIMKTPVDWIHSALVETFGSGHVSLEKCYSPSQLYEASGARKGQSDFEIVVMDCILSRTIKIHKVKGKKAAKLVDTPVKMYSYVPLHTTAQENKTSEPDIAEADSKCPVGLMPKKLPGDDFFRACVVIVPDAGVFYCHRERRKRTAGVENSHIPMDINWLRLRCNSKSTSENWFSAGSYVSRIADGDCCVWKWSVRRSELNLLPPNCSIVGMAPRLKAKSTHNTCQLTDEDGPALPPDFVDGEDLSTRCDCNKLTGLYRHAYSTSNSARRGCRHYAGGFLHKNIDPKTTFVIDPTKCAEMDLLVDVLIRHCDKKAALRRHSVVQIRYLPDVVGEGCDSLLQDINNHCKEVKRKGNGGARAGKGDRGKMHPIGTRIDQWGNKVRYCTSSDPSSVHLLSKAVMATSKLASVTIPGVLRVAQDLENDASMKALDGMNGDGRCVCCRVAHSMDLSVNLSNASHYDVNDACQGFSIWTEEKPGTTDDWYLVLPNMQGTFPYSDREYYGIAIKLTHGVLISWDGRLIRHCTSIMSRNWGDVFGTFFAAKTKVIKRGMLDSQRKEKEGESSLECGGILPPEMSVIDVQIDDDNCSTSIVEESEDDDDGNTDDESYDGGISDGGR